MILISPIGGWIFKSGIGDPTAQIWCHPLADSCLSQVSEVQFELTDT